MKVAVSGSRTIEDYQTVFDVLKESPFEIDELIHGGARGVDSLAERFAEEAGIPTIIIRPDWKRYRGRAGPLRNRIIVDQADALIAIWDGESSGTKGTIKYAEKQGKPVHVRTFKQFAQNKEKR